MPVRALRHARRTVPRLKPCRSRTRAGTFRNDHGATRYRLIRPRRSLSTHCPAGQVEAPQGRHDTLEWAAPLLLVQLDN